MRLFNKGYRALAVTIVSLLLIGSIAQYFIIRQQVINRVDRRLLNEMARAEKQIQAGKVDLSKIPIQIGNTSILNSASSCPISLDNQIENETGEELEFRVLTKCIEINQKFYQITLRRDLEESGALTRSLFITTISVLILILLLMNFIGNKIYKRLLTPLFDTINLLKKKNLASEPVHFPNVRTTEFNELNQELNELAAHIYNEFQDQSAYNDQLSHEIMTPLSVIQGRLELLIQSPQLEESEMEAISAIMHQVDRLKRLNQALILINRISFYDTEHQERINLNHLIKDVLSQFEDQIRIKSLSVRLHEKDVIEITNIKGLIEILLRNLIQNAIRHNIQNGILVVELDKNTLTVKNSSNSGELQPNVFDRFYKNSSSPESLGLGLSIVKRICHQGNIRLNYSYEDGLQVFRLAF